MRKKIYIKAYINKNLGDDLFVKMLLDKYQETDFFLCCEKKMIGELSSYKNLHCPGYLSLFLSKIIKKILKLDETGLSIKLKNQCDAVVNIGGSIYIEQPNWKSNIKQRKFKQKLFTIGANFGPYCTETFKDEVEMEILSSNDTCFRDLYSYNMFSHLPQVRYAPDILFDYHLPKTFCKSKTIGISIINSYLKKEIAESGDNYINIIAEVCDIAIDKGYEITLFAFCTLEGDEKAAKKILSRIKNAKKVNYCGYEGNINEFLDSFCSMEYIIATRFHSMILGWVANKRVFPIIYSTKLLNVIKDVGFTGEMWDLRKCKNYDPESLLSNLFCQPILENIDFIKKESQKQFFVLNSFLLSGDEKNEF